MRRNLRLLGVFVLFVARFALAAPVIGTQPVALSVTSGQPATFSVAATGTGTLTYQWRRNGFDLPGATTATYSIASTQQSDAALTTCL